VDALAEREVLLEVVPIRAELVRVGEQRFVPIGRGVDGDEVRPGGRDRTG